MKKLFTLLFLFQVTYGMNDLNDLFPGCAIDTLSLLNALVINQEAHLNQYGCIVLSDLETAYYCRYCFNFFRFKDDYINHQMYHSLYRCAVPGCLSIFESAERLADHYKTDHSEQ